MKYLVTGAAGFAGRNLAMTLKTLPDAETMECDIGNNSEADLAAFAERAGFVFHLAGVNRPKDPSEFETGNSGFTRSLLDALAKTGRKIPVLMSSSVQAALDNPYGRSKRAAEDEVFAYSAATGSPVYVFRLPNVFGKWSRPSYNSAVATWCHNIARGLPIEVRDPAATITLVHIDDVVSAFLACARGETESSSPGKFLSVEQAFTRTLGEVSGAIRSFRDARPALSVPDQSDPFLKRLYSTYLSFLPEDGFSSPLAPHCDARGSFTELLRTPDRGQVSVNIAHPGVTKGNHWHHLKHEKFIVVSGEGAIRFRKAGDPSAPVIEYRVSGAKPESVDIPPGYTHNIENTGTEDLVTVMWANEPFDPAKPDTWPEKV